MVYVANLFHGFAKVAYFITNVNFASSAAEHQLGSPQLPDQVVVLFVLALFGFRKTLWAIVALAWVAYSTYGGDAHYVLGHARDFAAVISRWA